MSQTEINELKNMLIEQNRKSDDHRIAFEDYVKDDKEWKENVTPSIEMMKKMSNWSDGTIFLLKFLGAVGTAVGIIWAFIKYIKN